ncbi:hypothetical protein ELH80_14005 [Rhizobium ruizarguesonis]|uniref:hypothetical protein n=1 Tax=Rhizobium ruizarguesonis TaxID=2081791 RepID=UPI001031DEDC|nr:hypothetical protein [Rhizobium ruizarguesonis]TAZ35403.1 hypothetical protein ELH80_14005 [Rhizobium ruizarguesonis]
MTAEYLKLQAILANDLQVPQGFLNVGEVSCGVSLYTAASTAERVTFNTNQQIHGKPKRRTTAPRPPAGEMASRRMDDGEREAFQSGQVDHISVNWPHE